MAVLGVPLFDVVHHLYVLHVVLGLVYTFANVRVIPSGAIYIPELCTA